VGIEEIAMDRTLIANATIFDGSGTAPFSGDVLVDGQRVTAVQPGGGLSRAGARLIDGTGATLMPGLVEPHGHVSYPDAATNADFTRLPPEEHVLVTMRNARTMLECGYTSVLSGASAKPRLDIVIRNEIEAGRIPGPRYLANGPEITVTGGLGDENTLHLPHLETPTFAWVADGADEIRKVCRLLVREGTDLLKLNISGDTGPRDSRSQRAVMTDTEVAAAMEIARAALPGTFPFQINVPGPRDLYAIRSRFPEDLTPGGRSRVLVDQYTGQVLFAESSRTAPAGTRMVIANRALHTGDIFGLPTKLLMSLASLMAAVQALSGAVMWWKRRQ
jgi:hypothetical protein